MSVGALGSVCNCLVGKRGASVVLLHGPPGVGKTLTAEAMAENFHKPLYPVSMGELGENSKYYFFEFFCLLSFFF